MAQLDLERDGETATNISFRWSSESSDYEEVVDEIDLEEDVEQYENYSTYPYLPKGMLEDDLKTQSESCSTEEL